MTCCTFENLLTPRIRELADFFEYHVNDALLSLAGISVKHHLYPFYARRSVSGGIQIDGSVFEGFVQSCGGEIYEGDTEALAAIALGLKARYEAAEWKVSKCELEFAKGHFSTPYICLTLCISRFP